MKRWLRTIAVTLILSPLPVVAQGASPQVAPADLAEDLRGIRIALERLVVLQEAADHRDDADLLIRRIELADRRLEPLEKQLREARGEVQGLEDHLKSLEAMREQEEERLNEEIRDGVDAPRSETRRMLEDIDRTHKQQSERLETTEQRARRYEAELDNARRDVRALDDMLLDMLEERTR